MLKISELGIAKRKDLYDAIKLISEEFNLIEYQGSRKTGGYVLTERGEAYILNAEMVNGSKKR